MNPTFSASEGMSKLILHGGAFRTRASVKKICLTPKAAQEETLQEEGVPTAGYPGGP